MRSREAKQLVRSHRAIQWGGSRPNRTDPLNPCCFFWTTLLLIGSKYCNIVLEASKSIKGTRHPREVGGRERRTFVKFPLPCAFLLSLVLMKFYILGPSCEALANPGKAWNTNRAEWTSAHEVWWKHLGRVRLQSTQQESVFRASHETYQFLKQEIRFIEEPAEFMGILQNAKINSLIKWLWNSKTDSELLDKMFPVEMKLYFSHTMPKSLPTLIFFKNIM